MIGKGLNGREGEKVFQQLQFSCLAAQECTLMPHNKRKLVARIRTVPLELEVGEQKQHRCQYHWAGKKKDRRENKNEGRKMNK
jgi:hypothetical protein